MGKRATYSLVVSHEVQKEEIAACFVFINDWVETKLLNRKVNQYEPPDQENPLLIDTKPANQDSAEDME